MPPGSLLLEETERQVLGEFFVAAAAFHEGRNAEARANYRLAAHGCWRPGNPDPRHEIASSQVIIVEGLVAKLRGSVHSGRGVNRPRVQPEVDLPVGRFVERSVVLEAYAEVHGERRSHTPVVLHIGGENIAPKLGGRTELAAGVPFRSDSPRNAAQPEVGQAGVRCSSETQIAKRAIISRIDVILALAHVLKTALDLVAAMSKDHVVFQLALGGVEYLNQIAKSETGCSSIIARDIEFNQARCLSVAAGNAECLTDIAQRGGWRYALSESDSIEAEASFVQQIRADRMGPVNNCIPDGLVAALRGAAVAEHAAREGWLFEIHVRPASEDMVFLRGVEVDLHVVLVVVQIVSALIKNVVPLEVVERRHRIVIGHAKQGRGHRVDGVPSSRQIVIWNRIANVWTVWVYKLGRHASWGRSPSTYPGAIERSAPIRAQLPKISAARTLG